MEKKTEIHLGQLADPLPTPMPKHWMCVLNWLGVLVFSEVLVLCSIDSIFLA